MSGLVVVSTLGGFGGVTALNAATNYACSQCSPPVWHAVETANFRILCFGTQGVSRDTADGCEKLRDKLAGQWLGRQPAPNWNPKCDIVLHATDEAYVREVGGGGRNTVASALVDRKQGRIASRRIDVRSTQKNWLSTALGHELTHVVLADRFAARALPRWVDEGIAILADPTEKQSRHRGDLKSAIAARGEFRVLELITLADYPAAHRWGAFYGQSASLVQFLIDRSGEERFVEFVEVSFDRGYEQALQQVYQFGIADLERDWHAQLKAPPLKPKLASAASYPAGSPTPSVLEASLKKP